MRKQNHKAARALSMKKRNHTCSRARSFTSIRGKTVFFLKKENASTAVRSTRAPPTTSRRTLTAVSVVALCRPHSTSTSKSTGTGSGIYLQLLAMQATTAQHLLQRQQHRCSSDLKYHPPAGRVPRGRRQGKNPRRILYAPTS